MTIKSWQMLDCLYDKLDQISAGEYYLWSPDSGYPHYKPYRATEIIDKQADIDHYDYKPITDLGSAINECVASGWSKVILFKPNHCYTGDYTDSGTVGKANFKWFAEQLDSKLCKAIHIETSAYSYQGIYIDIRFADEDMINTINGLAGYCLIDEDLHSEVETDMQNEAWESDYKEDWRKAIKNKLEPLLSDALEKGVKIFDYDIVAAEKVEAAIMLERFSATNLYLCDIIADQIADKISDDILYSTFRDACDKANEYWECSNEGAYINLDKCIEHFTDWNAIFHPDTANPDQLALTIPNA